MCNLMAPLLLGALLCAHCGLAQDSPLDIYSPKRLLSEERLYSLERRGGSPSGSSGGGGNMGSSFIRFGRADSAVSQPHTRSDVIIRYGRDGSFAGRLNRVRQERARKLARLALICASQESDSAPSSAEERILREICRDAPAHPTVPDFV